MASRLGTLALRRTSTPSGRNQEGRRGDEVEARGQDAAHVVVDVDQQGCDTVRVQFICQPAHGGQIGQTGQSVVGIKHHESRLAAAQDRVGLGDAAHLRIGVAVCAGV